VGICPLPQWDCEAFPRDTRTFSGKDTDLILILKDNINSVMLYTCIQEVATSNLGQETAIVTEIFCDILHPLHVNEIMVTSFQIPSSA
jgi:hypothetical protein